MADIDFRGVVLEWVSIFWFSRAGHTACSRIYFENYHESILQGTSVPRSTIPMGLSYFPQEIAYARPSYVFDFAMSIGIIADPNFADGFERLWVTCSFISIMSVGGTMHRMNSRMRWWQM